VHDIERVPAEGRVLLVANHSGQLPFDAAMLGVSLLIELDPPRSPRALRGVGPATRCRRAPKGRRRWR